MKLSVLTLSALLPSAFALWPLPTSYTNGTTPLRLSPFFDIKLNVHNAPADLVAAVARAKGFLKTDKLQALVVDRGASSAQAISKAKTLPSLTISLNTNGAVKSISEEAIAPIDSRVESYTLTVPADGSGAVLKANSTLGLYRGLTTFGQLWYEWDGSTYSLSAPIQISDSPAYPYRGFMMDTARNYYPVEDILRTLDAMSWVKLNTLHWHIVDSQSFPLVIPGYTVLSEKGAYNAASVYTSADVKKVVAYAAARGIDVLPEIDTPGHTAVISKAFPEYIACNEATPWASFANEPPAGQLRLADEKTSQFTAAMLKAVATMFPSTLFSTGGDEINQNCYTQDTETQASLAASNKTFLQALDTFTRVNHAALRTEGKTAVVWEEMVLDNPVTLANDTLVLVWVSSANVAAVAATGHRLVHAASDYFYLDCGHGAWVGDFPTGNSWCDPFKSWQHAYTFDPVANLTTTEADLVLGGQSLLWAEQSSRESLDATIWPRAASTAELFWSGPGGDVQKALPRLHEAVYRFRTRGVAANALQPEWCALRPGACDLTA
ncbi:N-acetylhexosaminidase [Roridomyces roridus]|uniref:Beta-hexosaminidase n=1 Tax=Roridomyces roridus TaxID=1738132 RepID=A0AAD7CE69_9AGAR|nr:N-acetylhexosaminidase [Roridomyces roridus]